MIECFLYTTDVLSGKKVTVFFDFHRFFVRTTDNKPIIERAATIGMRERGDAVVVGGRGVSAALITTFCPGLIEPESVKVL